MAFPVGTIRPSGHEGVRVVSIGVNSTDLEGAKGAGDRRLTGSAA